MNTSKVVTRFAPSPTGYMHIGGVRTALYAWAFARKNNGTFILRIEDTDKEREVLGSIEHIITSLKWLGIEWDEGPDIGGPHNPYLQSQRLESYKKYAQVLIDKGLAYADPYTLEEIENFRKKSEEAKRPFLYRDYRPEHPPIWDGSQPLRLKISNVQSYEWNDLVRGTLKAGPEALDDFILIKSDGYPTYNFAHIIDDLEMGVTHIMRADEFISSTPKFLALYEALGVPRPEIATLPPLMAPDGKKKLSKRDGAKDILEYRDEGYLPEAMVNFLALIGWSPVGEQEIFTPTEFIQAFDVSRIHHSGGGFNPEKLNWFNREFIKKLSSENFWNYAQKFISNEITSNQKKFEIFLKLEDQLRDRIEKFSDIQTFYENKEFDYFFTDPIINPPLLQWKDQPLIEIKTHLLHIQAVLESIELTDFNRTIIKNTIWAYAELSGRGNVLWPFRVALSGRDKSPDPFILAELLGKDTTLKRLNYAASLIDA